MIGYKIRELMFRNNVKGSVLARHIGLKPGAVSNYRSGRREPNLATLEKIARYFDVDLNYFAAEPFEAHLNNQDKVGA